MIKILTAAILGLVATSASADTYNNISLQGQLTQPTPIYGVAVRVVSGGAIVGTGTDIDLLPDADMVFSTQTYITNPWVFRSGEDYILRLSSPSSGVVLATFTITAAPFAHTVRGNADTGTQNIFAAYGNAGVGTASPQYRLVVSSGGSDLMWVASDGVHATKFTGDGSGLTNVSGTGDNLGSHVATKTLDMAGYDINAAGGISATGYKQSGETILIVEGDENFYSGIGASPDGPPYGSANTSIGNDSGGWATVGREYNSFFGYGAAYSGTGGDENTILGAVAAGLSGIGSGNTMIGAWAGWDSSGDGNIFIGNNAGTGVRYATSDNNIMIGNNTHMSSYDASYKLNIGNLLYGDMAAYSIGIGTETPMAALDVVSTGTASNVYAQIWRNGTGVVVASMTSQGTLFATLGTSGDNLGNHTATQALNMGGFNLNNAGAITSVSTITGYSTMTVLGSAFSVGGSTLVVVNGRVGISSAAPVAQLGVQGEAVISSTLTVQSIMADNLVGGIMYFAKSSCPNGFLKANGAAVSRTTYSKLYDAIGVTFGSGDGSTTFNLPDIRGEFLRGYDDGRGVDSGRSIGTSQSDAFQGHRHRTTKRYNSAISGTIGPVYRPDGSISDDTLLTDPISDGVNGTPRVASETRPRNIALMGCIKY